MKKQTGITLIALIITIIVMLILVGVTINVALNGGLIEKANTASKQTQKEVDKEMLLSAVVATVDKYGNYHLDQVQEHLPEGEFTYNSTTKVYKSKNENEFTINETTGKVEEYVVPTTPSTPTQNPEETEEPELPATAKYPFTLAEIEDAFLSLETDFIEYDLDTVKETLEDKGDLFIENSIYDFGGEIGYNIKTNSDDIINASEAFNMGKENIDSKVKYIVCMSQLDDSFVIVLFNPTTFETVNAEGRNTFKTTYANTTFWFEEVE